MDAQVECNYFWGGKEIDQNRERQKMASTNWKTQKENLRNRKRSAKLVGLGRTMTVKDESPAMFEKNRDNTGLLDIVVS